MNGFREKSRNVDFGPKNALFTPTLGIISLYLKNFKTAFLNYFLATVFRYNFSIILMKKFKEKFKNVNFGLNTVPFTSVWA